MQQLLKRFWRIFTSMKFGILLLILYAGVSVIGTFVPQVSFAPEKAELISPFWQTFGLTNLYHSSLYRVVVALLALNLLSCTLFRIPGMLKTYLQSPKNKTVAQIERLPIKAELKLIQDQEEIRERLRRSLDLKHFRYQFEDQPEGLYAGWAQKNRIGVWGSLIVHCGFLILILGMALGNLGFKGYFIAPEGADFPLQELKLEKGEIHSNWNIDIHSAQEKYDAKGIRENWYTEVSVLEAGQELIRKTISVNHPLTYKGITFYQTSFEYGASFIATIQGQKVPFALQEQGQNYFQAPGTTLYLIVDTLSLEKGRAVVNYQVLAKESSQPVQQGVIRQNEQVNIQGLYDIALSGAVNFSGLVVKKDPGVPVIWLGSALLVAGLIFSFYFRPQQVWFATSRDEGTLGSNYRLVISLSTKAGQECAEELLEELKETLEQEVKENFSKRKGIRGLRDEEEELGV